MQLVLYSMDALHVHTCSACIKELCHVFIFLIPFPNNGQNQLIPRKEKVDDGGFLLAMLEEKIDRGAETEPSGGGFSLTSPGSWPCLPLL